MALDLTRSKSELVLENALPRQQLIVLQRQVKRPSLTWRDRCPGRKLPSVREPVAKDGQYFRATRVEPADSCTDDSFQPGQGEQTAFA
jgi:hypothetical protein